MTVGTAIAHRLTDDPAVHLESPQQLAGACIDRFEPSVHRAVEEQIRARHHAARPDGEILLVLPDGLARDRVPCGHLAAVAPRSGFHVHDRAHVRSPRDVADLHVLPVHAHVLVPDVEQSRSRAEARGVPILRARCRRADVTSRSRRPWSTSRDSCSGDPS